jgi:hypothetical protein
MAGISELEAVNMALRNIGESPVSSLLGAAGDIFVTQAQAALQSVTREVQLKEWNFNRDYNYSMAPDGSGNINLTAQMMSVESCYKSDDYVMRQGKLYDRYNQTFIFDAAIKVNVKWEFTFEELPQWIRNYVAIRAARKFSEQQLGDVTNSQLTQDDEDDAKVDAKRQDTKNAGMNLFSNPYKGLGRIHRRRIM